MFENTEKDVERFQLDRRVGALKPKEPARKTKLFLEKQKAEEVACRTEREKQIRIKAVEAFMRTLSHYNLAEYEYIDKSELKNALQDENLFSNDHYEVLFGDVANRDGDAIFNVLDVDQNGKISFYELLQFIEDKGVRIQARIQGYGRREVSNLMHFGSAIIKMVTTFKEKKLHFLDRTIGVNTGHVGTLDFDLDSADIDFVVERGYNATEAFFRYFVYNEHHLMKTETEGDRSRSTQTKI